MATQERKAAKRNVVLHFYKKDQWVKTNSAAGTNNALNMARKHLEDRNYDADRVDVVMRRTDRLINRFIIRAGQVMADPLLKLEGPAEGKIMTTTTPGGKRIMELPVGPQITFRDANLAITELVYVDGFPVGIVVRISDGYTSLDKLQGKAPLFRYGYVPFADLGQGVSAVADSPDYLKRMIGAIKKG